MSWTYDDSKKEDADFLRQFIAFLQSAICQRAGFCAKSFRPEFVPETVRLKRTVRSEIPGRKSHVDSGVYPVTSNQWGAIAVRDLKTEQVIGVMPDECVVLSMCPNPHLSRKQD